MSFLSFGCNTSEKVSVEKPKDVALTPVVTISHPRTDPDKWVSENDKSLMREQCDKIFASSAIVPEAETRKAMPDDIEAAYRDWQIKNIVNKPDGSKEEAKDKLRTIIQETGKKANTKFIAVPVLYVDDGTSASPTNKFFDAVLEVYNSNTGRLVYVDTNQSRHMTSSYNNMAEAINNEFAMESETYKNIIMEIKK